jgi:hypothetical protein
MTTAADIVKQIEQFSPVDRVKIIDAVIRDTIKPDNEIEKIWIREAEVRWDSFSRGEITPIPYAKVMEKYQEK